MTAWSSADIDQMREALLGWYDRHKRDLPWRNINDPYATWVSEIMLQQTQVATVIDYFNRWMARFPTVSDLAIADQDEVLAMWAGLGYYRRAKLLHKAAQTVQDEHNGQMPSTAKALLSLSGIGRYTAGAIASIAFGEAAPIVDGNVERILARIRAVDGDPKARENQKTFWAMAEQLVDPHRPGDFNQSMMELGATVCTPKKPVCLLCPVRGLCEAYAQGDVLRYPAKVKRAKKKNQHVHAYIVELVTPDDDARYLVMQRPDNGLLANMWEFLTVPMLTKDQAPDVLKVLNALLPSLEEVPESTHIGESTHIFTHIRMTFDVHLIRLAVEAPEIVSDRPAHWMTREEIDHIAVSKAQQKVWNVFEQNSRADEFDHE